MEKLTELEEMELYEEMSELQIKTINNHMDWLGDFPLDEQPSEEEICDMYNHIYGTFRVQIIDEDGDYN